MSSELNRHAARGTGPHVAVLFYRFGPYHHARLKAAGSRLQVTGVEFSNVDPTYAWDLVEGADGFNRVTLFSGLAVNELPSSRIFSRVGQVLDELRPQVVAIPGWYDRCSLAALRWCGSHGVPAVLMSETTAWDAERSWWKEFLKRRLIKLCAAGLVGGHAHADYLEQLGIERKNIFFGYDAVDNRYFEDKAVEIRKQKAESRNKHGLPENYFLASARFIEKKNLSRLIEAYARYRALARKSEIGKQKTENKNKLQPSAFSLQPLKGPWSVVSGPSSAVSGQPSAPWDLVLLGDGPLRSSIFDLRSSLGLDNHVLLPGFKQYGELPAYYGLAKAFIHASTTEQWGLVVNEAMASGLPVLVSNRCGCAMDLVQEGVNGFTFDPYNVEQLADLMLQLTTGQRESGKQKVEMEKLRAESGEQGLPKEVEMGEGRWESGNEKAETLKAEIVKEETGLQDYGPRTAGKEKAGQRSEVGGERPAVSLEKMGRASLELARIWDAAAFGKGLSDAVAVAMEKTPPQLTLPRRACINALVYRVKGLRGIDEQAAEAGEARIGTSGDYLLYSFAGRKVLAVPRHPRALHRVALLRYQPFTARRRLYSRILKTAIVTRSERAFSRNWPLPLTDELGFSYRRWTDLLSRRLGLFRVYPVLAWPSQPTRRRFYVHFLTEDLNPVAFVKVATNVEEGVWLEREAATLRELGRQGFGGIRLPRVLEHGKIEDNWYLALEPLPVDAIPPKFNRNTDLSELLTRIAGPQRCRTAEEITRLSWWSDYNGRLDASHRIFHSELTRLLPLGAEVCRAHGDMDLSNMVQDKESLWLFDWESTHPAAPAMTDKAGFFLSFNVGKVASRPETCLREFQNRFLLKASPRQKLDIMLALAFRFASNTGAAEFYIRNWNRLSRHPQP